MTLIKDLIHIPERVQRGDFVLNLASGLEAEAIDRTLKDYVVTPQLARCFEDALSFVKSTVGSQQNRNKGAYLHGSFGTGKSHFMAVLNLLLRGNAQARAIPELAASVAKHSDWMQSRNILLVPYHMIGAASIEAGVLGGYARHVHKLHPDAPVPGFYMSGRLFADAQGMRGHMGDERFFAALNAASGAPGGEDGWGDAATGWDALSFEAVLSGQAGEHDRDRLVSDLVGGLFRSFADLANTQSGGYIEFDEGLRVMTRHAKALGYDAVILFLDELILWLASRLSDRNFINSEIQKVVKLVETGIPRELPVISFIARQRDLREFVGDQYSGVEQEILSDSLKYWEGRFHRITLEDRNLPVIAQRRLLAPVSAAAQGQIEAAFAQTEKMREEAFTLLLTSQGDRDMFRALYPFSPALVQALVALSSALQRERTALKVMLMLLVEQRETLTLGRVIPVGDLYDVIASEAEPFSEQMRQHFDNARLLFERKLVPVLEMEHQIGFQALRELPADDPKRQAFDNDLRLLKTLVLAALVPEVESFKQLTATKLAALNHGTIRSPIPGREAATVLQKCRKWAGQVGEIKISEDANPTIGVQLSGVDTESILEQARINDNDGNRRRLVKEMVFDAFGIRDDNQLFVEHAWLWHGTRRRVDVLFQSILGITDDSVFESRDDQWKVIIDFPFGTGTHSPTDAQARVRDFEAAGGQARTICWLPYFLSQSAQKNLGKLVVLEEILKSEDSFNRYSRHLSPQDRASARTLLDNQRSQLRQQLKDTLMGAYGVAQDLPGSLDNTDLLESQLMSLQPGFRPRPPAGTTMAKAFEQLLGQALAFQYPDHPEFDGEVRTSDLGKVFTELRRAIHAPHGRIDVDSPLRPLMRQIAQPLKLGEMHERHFIFKEDWPQHLARVLAKAGGDVTVRALRAAMDDPRPRGLPTAVQNLLILVFVEHGQYAFTFHGGPFDDVSLKDIRDDLVLIKQDLAAPETWQRALEHAGAVFGLTVNALRTANNQNALQKEVQAEVNARLEDCRTLVEDLTKQLDALGLAATGNRLANAQLAVRWLEDLQSREGPDLVAALAALKPVTSLQALGRSIIAALRVSNALADNNWALLEAVWGTGDGVRIKHAVAEALAADELVTALAEVLKQAQMDATQLVRPNPPNPPFRKGGFVGEGAGVGRGQTRKVLKQDDHQGLDVREARRVLKEIEPLLRNGVTLDISYQVIGNTDD
ncbi:phage resistance protein [Thiorhodococcus mannitoliphagus]|uniref:Phage resistance protein n=1 Tax=Thiorhodococcus mannitoliphagus TaxID=329406 RepID=A0A6P1DUP7_9GAMM|nr:phage resistance protein [Thiorhodococcus mannitoliphagus]NEX20416.1 phage resistance protein [Thiorhodococcus mannitoliphagus]